jgi:hypothetical protein
MESLKKNLNEVRNTIILMTNLRDLENNEDDKQIYQNTLISLINTKYLLMSKMEILENESKYNKNNKFSDTMSDLIDNFYIITKNDNDRYPINAIYAEFKAFYNEYNFIKMSFNKEHRKMFIQYLESYGLTIKNNIVCGLKHKFDDENDNKEDDKNNNKEDDKNNNKEDDKNNNKEDKPEILDKLFDKHIL